MTTNNQEIMFNYEKEDENGDIKYIRGREASMDINSVKDGYVKVMSDHKLGVANKSFRKAIIGCILGHNEKVILVTDKLVDAKVEQVETEDGNNAQKYVYCFELPTKQRIDTSGEFVTDECVAAKRIKTITTPKHKNTKFNELEL